MPLKKINLRKILFYAIVFFLPTQLAYHFWPSFSFVNGIRVDYLSPSVYLTDILIVLFLIISFLDKSTRDNIKKHIIHNIKHIILFVFLILLNILFAHIPQLALIAWLKIALMALFFYTFISREIPFEKWFPYPFILSVLLIVLLQFLQFINQGSLQSIFYFLGERRFDVNTIGIALVDISGRSYLRPYSTFPHPNALGGFLLVGMFLLISFKRHINKPILIFALVVSLLGIIFSFSQAVWLAGLFIIGIHFLKVKNFKPLLITLVFLSFLLIIISPLLLNYSFSRNISQRFDLLSISREIFINNPIFGVGLNNFIPLIPSTKSVQTFWLLQPVHNIFVLYLVETGIVGVFATFVLLKKSVRKHNFAKVDVYLKYALLVVFLTGFVDHYWLTLQQNILLFVLLLAFVFRNVSTAKSNL